MELTEVAPASIILLEGNFSASPHLRDLIDLAVLIDVSVRERHLRIVARQDAGFLEKWHAIWDEVEDYYYKIVNPPSSYDLVVSNNSNSG
jgi:uridine kinase